ncbi:MAG: chloride channel protein [Edaphobacter sp.]
MTTTTVARVEATENAIATWLTSAAWAILLGVASGSSCVVVRFFFRFLQWLFVQQTGMLPFAAANLTPERRIMTPIIGAAFATLVLWTMRRSALDSRFEEYVEAVRLRDGRIPLLSTAWRTLSSAFSVATGAAIGREGSMIQFAAAIISWMGARAPIKNLSLSRQVAYGVAAAVGAVYQAPIAGVFFAMEIVLGEFSWSDISSLLLVSGSGWMISRITLGAGPLFPTMGQLSMSIDLLWAFPLAVLLGVSGPAYQKLLHLSKAASRLPLPLLWSGLAVGLFSLVEPRVWGNGDVALLGILQNKATLVTIAGVLACRIAVTTFCVGTGTVGGVFTPTLFAGAAIGLAAGHLLYQPEPLIFAVCGMAMLMAAVTHAPLMASAMAIELTGQWHLLPVIILCTLLASFIARTISRDSMYAIASPQPAP